MKNIKPPIYKLIFFILLITAVLTCISPLAFAQAAAETEVVVADGDTITIHVGGPDVWSYSTSDSSGYLDAQTIITGTSFTLHLDNGVNANVKGIYATSGNLTVNGTGVLTATNSDSRSITAYGSIFVTDATLKGVGGVYAESGDITVNGGILEGIASYAGILTYGGTSFLVTNNGVLRGISTDPDFAFGIYAREANIVADNGTVEGISQDYGRTSFEVDFGAVITYGTITARNGSNIIERYTHIVEDVGNFVAKPYKGKKGKNMTLYSNYNWNLGNYGTNHIWMPEDFSDRGLFNVSSDGVQLVDTETVGAPYLLAARQGGAGEIITLDSSSRHMIVMPLDYIAPTYTVNYNSNGAKEGDIPIDSNQYLQGDAVIVKGNEGGLDLTGYTFTGWNTMQDGSGTACAPGKTLIMPAADVLLYAQWAAAPVSVPRRIVGTRITGNEPAFGGVIIEESSIPLAPLPDVNPHTGRMAINLNHTVLWTTFAFVLFICVAYSVKIRHNRNREK